MMTTNNGNDYGYYFPKQDGSIGNQMSAVFYGQMPAFFKNEVTEQKLEEIPELSGDLVAEQISYLLNVMKQIPERWSKPKDLKEIP